jgi:trimethylamine:corrinoid methyltransferase-like protein
VELLLLHAALTAEIRGTGAGKVANLAQSGVDGLAGARDRQSQNGVWLEGGLTARFERLIVDAELLQMIAAYFDPIEVDDSTRCSTRSTRSVDGGHFFGSAHTLAQLRGVGRGRELDTTERAHRLWRRLLAEHEPPAVDAAPAEYVARRKAGHAVERSG